MLDLRQDQADAAIGRRETLARHGPLEGKARLGSPGLAQVAVLPPCERIQLQGDAAFAAAWSKALGLELPIQPCRSEVSDDAAALWLGPGEWLVLVAADDVRMPSAGQGLSGSAVRIGHRQAALAIDGPRAADLLNAACPLDLHPDAFPVGMCTRTVFGKAGVVLWRRGPSSFHLEVTRSFAAYAWGLLEQGMGHLPP